MMGVFLNLFSNYLLLLLLIISLIVKILIPSIPILIPLVITAIWIAWAIIKQFRYMKLILESDEPLFDRMFADNGQGLQNAFYTLEETIRNQTYTDTININSEETSDSNIDSYDSNS